MMSSAAAETAVPTAPPTQAVATEGRLRRAPVRRAEPRSSRVVVGRVDPWAILKLSLLFYVSVCLVLLVAGVLLWTAASSAGVIDNVENFVIDIGFDGFRFLPGQILRGFALGGLLLVLAGSFANVLMAILYNLIADVIGGLKLTLVEDESKRNRV